MREQQAAESLQQGGLGWGGVRVKETGGVLQLPTHRLLKSIASCMTDPQA